ncbi:cytochrome P450 [Hypoxylon sp. FL0890]|nr:cytochrome P450 [Hypoxylon sp. FL0890]
MGLETGKWREVCLHDAMQTILRRVISCVLVGLPWCRDEECLTAWTRFLHCLAVAGTILGAVTPWFLRPFLGLLLRIPVDYMRRRSLRTLAPIFIDRWKQIEEYEKSSFPPRKLPDDFVTWSIQEARKGNMEGKHDAVSLASEFLFFSIAFFDAVIGAAEVTMLDLLGTDPPMGYWEKIVEEASATFRTNAHWIHAGSVSKLACTDSAIRESLRRNPFSIRNVTREVIWKDGLTLPSGTHLPRGTWLTTALANVHRDARFYAYPTEYRPFRFVAKDSLPIKQEDSTDKASQPAEAILASTIDEKFLTFGYGRRAWYGIQLSTRISNFFILALFVSTYVLTL